MSIYQKNGAKYTKSHNVTNLEIAWKSKGTQEYIQLTERCLSSMQEVSPLTEVSTDRLSYKAFKADYQIKQNSLND